MARYRRVETKVWLDSGFRSFSAPQPNAQTLWLYLLCGPRTTIFPGLVVAREEVMASDLGWALESFRKAFAEASSKDRIKVDRNTGVTVLSRALFDSAGDPRESAKPGNPNILKSWAKEWEQIPECSLKDWYIRQLKTFCEALKESFGEAFTQALGKAYAKACLNQDQDQDQDQEQKEKNSDTPPAVGTRSLFGDAPKQRQRQRTKNSDWTADEVEGALYVLSKLAAQSGVQYSGTDEHKRLIINQLRRGLSEVDLRSVIAYCAVELKWADKPDMAPYLRPETLFGPKNISKYLDAARTWIGSLAPEFRPQPRERSVA